MPYENPDFGAHKANGYRENGNGVCLFWPFWPFSKGPPFQYAEPNFSDFFNFFFFLGVLQVCKKKFPMYA